MVRVRVSKRGNRVWSSGKGEGSRGNEVRRSGEVQSEVRRGLVGVAMR